MKICQTSLSEIFGDCFLRCDVKNILMRQKYDLNSFAKMSEFITFIETGKPICYELNDDLTPIKHYYLESY